MVDGRGKRGAKGGLLLSKVGGGGGILLYSVVGARSACTI